jgi:hypothetical protein
MLHNTAQPYRPRKWPSSPRSPLVIRAKPPRHLCEAASSSARSRLAIPQGGSSSAQPRLVIPAKAGIQYCQRIRKLDSRLRGNDEQRQSGRDAPRVSGCQSYGRGKLFQRFATARRSADGGMARHPREAALSLQRSRLVTPATPDRHPAKAARHPPRRRVIRATRARHPREGGGSSARLRLVIPAKAGIQCCASGSLDSRLRGTNRVAVGSVAASAKARLGRRVSRN